MFTAAAVDAVLSILMLLAWRTRKTYAGFGAWICTHLFLLPAFVLLGLRGGTFPISCRW
jgi:hypothetical protein